MDKVIEKKILGPLDQHRLTGLSMAAEAQPVHDITEVPKALSLLGRRYPEYTVLPMPKPG